MVTMPVEYTISSKLAEIYLLIGTRRYNAFHAINVEATITKKKNAVPILGRLGTAQKAAGWDGAGSAEFHANTSIFKDMMIDYAKNGIDSYFEMQITNEDPSSGLGRQTVILKEVNIDDLVIAAFDASSDDPVREKFNFTFGDIEMPEKFKSIKGM